MGNLHEKKDCTLVIQTKQLQHGCQVVETDHIKVQLTEYEIDLLSQVFSHSDAVQSFIFGRKRDEKIDATPTGNP